jgi:hypothetical protein
MNIDRNAYLSMRRRYEPDVVRLVIITESPPASGLYFYNPTGGPEAEVTIFRDPFPELE